MKPVFVSLTLQAGGSSSLGEMPSAQHQEVFDHLCAHTPPPVAAHITCVGKSRDCIQGWLDAWWQQGVRRFVALRGDNPEITRGFTPHQKGYASSLDLIAYIRDKFGLDATIYVGSYPEKHPDALSLDSDLEYLKEKFDHGANVAITQFFFSPEMFLRFRDRAFHKGITHPIVPGLLPLHDYEKVVNISRKCGISIPSEIHEKLGVNQSAPHKKREIAIEHAIKLCQTLFQEGVEHFHFYTLNHSNLIPEILQQQGWATIDDVKTENLVEKEG